MFQPWITVPATDIRVQLPMSIYDGDIKILFRDPETIDNVIEQMERLKEYMKKEGIIHV